MEIDRDGHRSSAAFIRPGFARGDGSARRRFSAELADRPEGAKTFV
jgi:hypothetical protein